jgi:hypothetical protein
MIFAAVCFTIAVEILIAARLRNMHLDDCNKLRVEATLNSLKVT